MHLFEGDGSNYLPLEETCELWKYFLAKHIIEMMVHVNFQERPTTQQILKHPFFWDSKYILKFFENANEFLQANKMSDEFNQFTNAKLFFSGNWMDRIHKEIAEKCTKYNEFSAVDLIRAMRNRVSIYCTFVY